MEFDKINYTKLRLKSTDKVSKSIIRQQIQQNNNQQVNISTKQVKQSVKVLSRQNNRDSYSVENNL